MNYYDSDCFKLAKEFKRELDRIKDDGMLIDSVSHVGAQLNKAVLCYRQRRKAPSFRAGI